jgi:multiple sugar transport system permease protein
MKDNRVLAGWRDRLSVKKREIWLRRMKSVFSDILHYVVVISLSFVFLYPMLYLLSRSLMTSRDIADLTVQWIPKGLSFENFIFAFKGLNYWPHFLNNLVISVGSALLQGIGCAIAGYGFARYRFPGYSLMLALLIFTFLVPPQPLVVPLLLFFSDLDWTNTYLPFLVPSLFGHGLRGALFVLVYMQFFRGLPTQMEEAAKIDGAGAFRTFFQIMLPLARPAVVVVLLFSIVWHWNDTFLPNLYLMKGSELTLNQMLGIMSNTVTGDETGLSAGGDVIGALPTTREKLNAAALLTILPILILYLFAQRYFVEGVERTGIAGE